MFVRRSLAARLIGIGVLATAALALPVTPPAASASSTLSDIAGISFTTDAGTCHSGGCGFSTYSVGFSGSTWGKPAFFQAADSVSWSPDGKRIAWVGGNPGEVFVANADGSRAKDLGVQAASYLTHNLVWSPNGDKILYDTNGEQQWVISADGGTPVEQWGMSNDGCMFDMVGFGWLNENTIAFSNSTSDDSCFSQGGRCCDSSGNNKTFGYGSPGGLFSESVNTTPGATPSSPSRMGYSGLSSSDIAPFDIAISPTGGKIAYDDRDSSGNEHVYVGGSPVTPQNDTNDSGASWSPDGKLIAFSSQKASGYDIEIVPAGGGTPTNVTRGFVYSSGSAGNNQSPEFIPNNPPFVSIINQKTTRDLGGPVVRQINVSLSQKAPYDVTVDYATAAGTAVAGAAGTDCTSSTDYIDTSGTVTIPAGQQSASFGVKVCPGASDVANDVGFTVTLSNPGNAYLGSSTATITIESPPKPTISVSDQTLILPAPGTDCPPGACTGNVTVTLSATSTSTVTAHFATKAVTADSRYDDESGNLTFAAGQASAQAKLLVYPAGSSDPNTTLQFTLSDPTGATIGRSPGTITLQPVRQLSVLDETFVYPPCNPQAKPPVPCKDRTVAAPVLLSGPTTVPTSANFETQDINARAKTDYEKAAGVATFPGNASPTEFDVPITIHPKYAGANKHFKLILPGEVLPQADATIAKQDGTITLTAPALSIADQSVTRPTPTDDPNTVQLEVPMQLSMAPQQTVKIPWVAENGNAIPGKDYVCLTIGANTCSGDTAGTVTFGAGDTTQNIVFTIKANPNADHLETFHVVPASAWEKGTLTYTSRTTKDPGTFARVTIDTPRLIVNNPGDTSATSISCKDEPGDCTLRAAIQILNRSKPGMYSSITFDMPGNTISPGSALPAVARSVTIDGSNSGADVQIAACQGCVGLEIKAADTVQNLAVYGGSPNVQLDSAATDSVLTHDTIGALNAQPGSAAIIDHAINATIGPMVTVRGTGKAAIELLHASDTTIEGDQIGDPAGSTDTGQLATYGIWVNNSTNTTIGGADASLKNTIVSSNGDGIHVEGSSAGLDVIGNQIGPAEQNGTNGGAVHDPDANRGAGIVVTGSAKAVIRGNQITGNDTQGIFLGNGAENATVTGNQIGTDAAMDLSGLGNGGDGIDIQGVTGVMIGGPTGATSGGCSGPCNLIAGNGGAGVHINGADGDTVVGNVIGARSNNGNVGELPNALGGVLVDTTSKDDRIGDLIKGDGNVISFNNVAGVARGAHTGSNAILSNSMFSNASSILDNRPSGQQSSPPTLTDAVLGNGSLRVFGKIPAGSGKVIVQVFASSDCTSPQGQTLIGSKELQRGTNGLLLKTPAAKLPGGEKELTATATRLDPAGQPTDTSVFSNCIT